MCAISLCGGPQIRQTALQQTSCRDTFAAGGMENTRIQECFICLAAWCPSKEETGRSGKVSYMRLTERAKRIECFCACVCASTCKDGWSVKYGCVCAHVFRVVNTDSCCSGIGAHDVYSILRCVCVCACVRVCVCRIGSVVAHGRYARSQHV